MKPEIEIGCDRAEAMLFGYDGKPERAFITHFDRETELIWNQVATPLDSTPAGPGPRTLKRHYTPDSTLPNASNVSF